MIRTLFLFSLSAMLATGCGDRPGGDENPAGSSSATAAGANRITFKVDGAEVTTTGHNISRSIMGGKVALNITSSMHTDERTINVNIAGTTAGTYTLDPSGYGFNGKSDGLYYPSYLTEMGNAYQFQSGQIVLSKVDTAAGILEGIFSGTAKSSDGSKTVQITEGRIVAGALNKDVQDPEAEFAKMQN